jgi:hypothetical protein
MQTPISVAPGWPALIVWGVVNAVNVLQAVGFLSRLSSGSRSVNHILGYVILGLAVPAVAALAAFLSAHAGWRQWAGVVVFVAFLGFMLNVDYLRPVEFRSPPQYAILIPYLLLFFGAILLMGLPMYRLNRSLWLVTVATTVFLLAAMGAALRAHVG